MEASLVVSSAPDEATSKAGLLVKLVRNDLTGDPMLMWVHRMMNAQLAIKDTTYLSLL